MQKRIKRTFRLSVFFVYEVIKRQTRKMTDAFNLPRRVVGRQHKPEEKRRMPHWRCLRRVPKQGPINIKVLNIKS